MKILCAVSTPFQVNFFEELVRRREEEFFFAARDRDATLSMLEDKDLPNASVGGYNGRSLDMKLKEFANSLISIGNLVDEYKPDLVLTERYPPAVHVAHLADTPSWTIFNDEREFHVNRLTHPLASRVLVPSFYDMEVLRNQGVTDEEKVVWFNGFITCYLKDAPIPDVNPYPSLEGFEEGKPVLLLRPEFEFSVFFDHYEPVLEKVVGALINKLDINIVVLPRTNNQRERYGKMGAIVPEKSLPGNPIVHADVVLGSAETMLCEAFTLGVPAVSCIYWDLTIPMRVLHDYIPHATEPDEVLRLTTEFIESSESRKQYRELSTKVIGGMENPVDVIGNLLDSEVA